MSQCPTSTSLPDGAYEALFTHGIDGFLLASPEGEILRANPRACELLGRSEAELIEVGRAGLVDRRDPRWVEAVERRGRDGAYRGVLRLRRGDGSTFPAEVSTALLPGGDTPLAYVSFRDMTAAEAEAARTAESRRAAAEVVDSLESFSDMYFGVDADWRITYINAQAEARLGVSRDDVVGRDLWQHFPDLLGTPFEEAYREAVRTRRPVTVEACYAAADLWAETRVFPLRRGGLGVYFRDVGERRAMEQERERLLTAERRARTDAERAQHDLAHRATHDDLTGLPNRTGLVQQVGAVLDRWPVAGMTLLFIDLDRFKLVNDSLGHAAGDALLAVAASRLAELAGSTELVARFGGDEFVMAMFDASVVAADRMAAAVIAALSEPVETGARLAVTASVGMASSAVPADLDTLLREADAAMHRAKDGGGGRAAWFDEQMHLQSVHRVRTERDLRLALERDELFLEYQPAFDLRFERITHVEALVRWRHPERGVVPPLEFVPVAEEAGLIGRLGEWVLGRVVEQATRWAHVPGLRVWVNVSPRQLADGRMPDVLATHLARAGLGADRLGIEVTESTFADSSCMAAVLEEVRALGVAVAIDDFGTGYSSLARLGDLPVDVIKIDRSFVQDLGTARGEAVLSSIVTLAHALDAEVIAEGVETLEQLRALSVLGADSASGFLLARPAAPEHLPMVLADPASARPQLHPSVARVPRELRVH
ncbi:bifunctional diguanylate cyclase/phosphodiesterase [Geodermatophilus sp. DSM 45219]|uniref:putative bifunctional diguanylate cyclase/phosphodiesterase n=1 Tax=Geodermatophilus sp. DSM 45219 TaxID=1881103 RepID=UPI000885FBC6|nr:EAL domain-containing protein [Geodermatophilus sp. DSM 45219]SDO20356.1 cyclic di-GMP phosphodiesterase Gmr [Geodermatophilus sp. DSM 45219]